MMKPQKNENVVIISYKMYEELREKYEQVCLDYEILKEDYFKLLDQHLDECFSREEQDRSKREA